MFDLLRFKALCKERGLTQTSLFAKVGKKATYSSDISKGTTPPMEYISVWAEILGTTPAYLLGETDDPAPVVHNVDNSDQFPPEVQELLRIAEKDPVALDAMLAVARAIVARRDDKK